MIKYFIFKETFEYNPNKFANASEAWRAYNDHDNHPIASFDMPEEAKSFFETCEPTEREFSSTLRRTTCYTLEVREGYDDVEDLSVDFYEADILDEKFFTPPTYDTTLDFTIVKKAYRFHHSRRGMDEGYIVRHEGELFFVYDPNGKEDIVTCEDWSDIENLFCIDEYLDTIEDYNYYETGTSLPINLEV